MLSVLLRNNICQPTWNAQDSYVGAVIQKKIKLNDLQVNQTTGKTLARINRL